MVSLTKSVYIYSCYLDRLLGERYEKSDAKVRIAFFFSSVRRLNKVYFRCNSVALILLLFGSGLHKSLCSLNKKLFKTPTPNDAKPHFLHIIPQRKPLFPGETSPFEAMVHVTEHLSRVFLSIYILLLLKSLLIISHCLSLYGCIFDRVCIYILLLFGSPRK